MTGVMTPKRLTVGWGNRLKARQVIKQRWGMGRPSLQAAICCPSSPISPTSQPGTMLGMDKRSFPFLGKFCWTHFLLHTQGWAIGKECASRASMLLF